MPICRILLLASVLVTSCRESGDAKSKSIQTDKAEESATLSLNDLNDRAKESVYLLKIENEAGEVIGNGTGFLVSDSGMLVTNRHVVENAHKATALGSQGDHFKLEGVLAYSESLDVVVLKVECESMPWLELSKQSGSSLSAGDPIAVIGSPLGLDGSLSNGIVSAIRPDTKSNQKDKIPMAGFIQITAPISPGSSGSPVLNMKGEVVGVATLSLKDSQNLNFAIPSARIEELINKAKIKTIKPIAFSKFSQTRISELAIEVFTDNEYEKYTQADNNHDFIAKLKAAKSISSRFPNNYIAYFYLGNSYADLNLHDEAIASWKKGLSLNDSDAALWLNMGVQLGIQGRHKEALDALQRAISNNPDLLGVWCAVGISHAALKDHGLAVVAYRKELAQNPNDDLAWFKLGSSLYAQGEHDNSKIQEAISAFKNAASLGNSNAKEILDFISKGR